MTYKLLNVLQEELLEMYLKKGNNQKFADALNNARNAILELMKFF